MVKLELVGLLASALLATTAFAGPKVGDQALLEGVYTAPGISTEVSIEKKISAYDANTDVFTVDATQRVASDVQTASENVASADMMSDELATQILEACSAGIGDIQEIKVKAGSFRTCHVVTEETTEIWIAPVPFGLVKVVSKTDAGETTNLELSSFTRGN
jgi:hypothetical protein